MLKKVNREHFPIIKEFVNQYSYKVCTNSVLEGGAKGEVFSDSGNAPSIALMWFKPATVYVYGKVNDIDEFNKDLKKVFDEWIIPECAKERCGGSSISFFEEKYWESFTEKLIVDGKLIRSGRWVGVFDKESYLRKELPKPLPEGSEICKIDKDILSNKENAELKEEILDEGWSDINDYLEKGIGFCVMKNSKVISSCYSVYISDNYHYEITVNTFSEEERNKGFASHCAIAFIDHCLENKFIPHWEADHKNFASHKLAKKIGFSDSFIENKFIFFFNRADN
ncbi:MAG: GNAT family N-acetyltransferase [Candidatus Delongbacteria bacterium]|nr:GNAT family N-acetyltransferase [Candidatus Delongbacteria bacterium]